MSPDSHDIIIVTFSGQVIVLTTLNTAMGQKIEKKAMNFLNNQEENVDHPMTFNVIKNDLTVKNQPVIDQNQNHNNDEDIKNTIETNKTTINHLKAEISTLHKKLSTLQSATTTTRSITNEIIKKKNTFYS